MNACFETFLTYQLNRDLKYLCCCFRNTNDFSKIPDYLICVVFKSSSFFLVVVVTFMGLKPKALLTPFSIMGRRRSNISRDWKSASPFFHKVRRENSSCLNSGSRHLSFTSRNGGCFSWFHCIIPFDTNIYCVLYIYVCIYAYRCVYLYLYTCVHVCTHTLL